MPSSPEIPTLTRTRRSLGLALSMTLVLAGSRPAEAAAPAVAAAVAATVAATPHDPAAEAAYNDAVALVQRREYVAAVVKLDLATELEPGWSEPVRLRAEAFGALADRYHPSAAFMSSRMADLQRLLALEPEVDTVARQREVATLQRRSNEARKVEQRRRNLSPVALVAVIATGALVISGAMLYSMKPNEFLKPSAYRYEHRDAAGLGMLIAGALLVPPAVVLGVLAGRQARRDSALRDFNVKTGRPRADFGVTPQYVAGGGGLGFRLRF